MLHVFQMCGIIYFPCTDRLQGTILTTYGWDYALVSLKINCSPTEVRQALNARPSSEQPMTLPLSPPVWFDHQNDEKSQACDVTALFSISFVTNMLQNLVRLWRLTRMTTLDGPLFLRNGRL